MVDPEGRVRGGRRGPPRRREPRIHRGAGTSRAEGEWIPLGDVRYGSGAHSKTVTVWAVEGDLDPSLVVPGTFEMEWPPRTGRMAEFPEIDRADWFDLTTANDKLGKGQRPYLDRLARILRGE